MKITDVKIRQTNGNGSIKATASITIDDAIAIHNIRIMEGSKGTFLSMPSRKGTDGKYWDIVHPVNADIRIRIHEAVMDAYKKELSLDGMNADIPLDIRDGREMWTPFDSEPYYPQHGFDDDEMSL